MNSLNLIPVPEGTRWATGESVDLAVLPIGADELATRAGLPLMRGIEDGLGPWAGIGGRLPSGRDVEFIWYAALPRQVILRVDKGAPYSATLDEALQFVGLSRVDVRVNPLANG
jgi:hypothetical protein